MRKLLMLVRLNPSRRSPSMASVPEESASVAVLPNSPRIASPCTVTFPPAMLKLEPLDEPFAEKATSSS